MSKPHYIKIRNNYINIESITSIDSFCPYDFSSNFNARNVRDIRAAVGDEITNKYFEYYSTHGGGYEYRHHQEGEKDIFVYGVNYDNKSILISPANFEKLSQLLNISEI